MPRKKKETEKTGKPAMVQKKVSKQDRLFENLLKVTKQFMMGKGFVSLTEQELIERLRLPEQHVEIFRRVLHTLIQQKQIRLSQGRYNFTRPDKDVISGIIRMHPRGFGFVQPIDSDLYEVDIFIPKNFTQNAVDGDTVEIIVNLDVVSEKGPEGRVVAILSRGRTHIAGIIRDIERDNKLIAYVPLLGLTQRVIVKSEDPENPLQIGDRIVMEVIDWGSKETETTCRFTHHIGHISDPSCDIKAAIEEYGIKADFPTRVIEEAKAFGNRVSQNEIKNREDLRDQECFTIDPETAKDFDDALTLKLDEEGIYHLGVHIADVSAYVRSGSLLDFEAYQRANSTYFPGTVVPMLPSALSDNLCSLKPNVNRLTASVMMRFDSQGNMLDYRIARTVIKSAKRFSYREAKEVLDGKKKSVHAPTLNLMVQLCLLLKKKRYERGSIEFALPEIVVIVDEKGVPQKTDYISYDITHQLVEEFMLKANEVVAQHLNSQGKHLAYRIHDEPSEENMKDFAMLVSSFGYTLPEKPAPADFQKLFDEAMHTSYGPYLASAYIRRMRMAIYSPENIGHYGLGLTHYCHFTSPIRRYIDLVIHRLLFNDVTHEYEKLEEISKHCSEQERISARAENSVVLLKKLRLLGNYHKEDPYREYEAIVTHVKNFGIFFEIVDLMIEGFLHISQLEDDYYVFEEEGRLRGSNHGSVFFSGEKLQVTLKSLNFITLESQWELAAFDDTAEPELNGTPRKGKKPEKGRRHRGQGGGKSHSIPQRPIPKAQRSSRPEKRHGPGGKRPKNRSKKRR